MAELWYYGRGSDISGPFSGGQLAGLAAAGEVLPTDTVWKEGVEEGVPALKVRNLFPSAPAAVAAVPAEPAAAALRPADPSPAVPPADAESRPVREDPQPPPRGRARAVAGKGAVIVGQDGITVKYRKKCTACGHEDSSWKSAPIKRGTTRSSFFCPKCRKQREVEVHGYLS